MRNSIVLTPRPYLSYSQLILWERSPEDYVEQYIYGQKRTNQYMELGKVVAEMLETDEEQDDPGLEMVRTYMPRYPKNEFQIEMSFKGIPLLGKLDGFDPAGRRIGEYKTGKKWTQRMVDESDQLTFYSILVWLAFKDWPSEIKLHWAETKMEGTDLKFTGQIKTFNAHRGMNDALRMYPRIQSAWEGIKKVSEKEYSKI